MLFEVDRAGRWLTTALPLDRSGEVALGVKAVSSKSRNESMSVSKPELSCDMVAEVVSELMSMSSDA